MKWIMLYVLLNGHQVGDIYDASYSDGMLPTKEICETSARDLKRMFEETPGAIPGHIICFGVVIDQSSQLDVKTGPKASAPSLYRKPAING